MVHQWGTWDDEIQETSFNVVAGLSIADHCMIGQAYPQFAMKENREFFKKWRAWAGKNIDYLAVKRDLLATGEETQATFEHF